MNTQTGQRERFAACIVRHDEDEDEDEDQRERELSARLERDLWAGSGGEVDFHGSVAGTQSKDRRRDGLSAGDGERWRGRGSVVNVCKRGETVRELSLFR